MSGRFDELTSAIERARDGVAAARTALARVDVMLAMVAAGTPATATIALRREAALRRITASLEVLRAAQAELSAFLASSGSAGLDIDVPVVLLPVRIETRFARNGRGARELLVRVYPDDIHVDDHEPSLTLSEQGAAHHYWTRLWRVGTAASDEERSSFVELAGKVGAPRAGWLVDRTRPTNLTSRPETATIEGTEPLVGPTFPVIDISETGFERAAHTTVLPDRWIVIGVRDGARVFTAIGAPIPNPLDVGPAPRADTPQDPAEPDTDDESDGPALLAGARWLVDFEAAVRDGMALRVPFDDDSCDRVLVIGVRAESAVDGAARLGRHLSHRRYGVGLSFLSVGAPTNNTADERAVAAADPGEWFDAVRAEPPGRDSASSRLAAAFGMNARMFRELPGSNVDNNTACTDLHNVAWNATIGYYAQTLLAGVVDDAMVAALRELFIQSVRGLGPLAPLRSGQQPYGVLPALSFRDWAPSPQDSTKHQAIIALLQRLRPEWLAATGDGPRTVPHVGRDSGAAARDPGQEILDILGRDALSADYRLRPVQGAQVGRAIALLNGDGDDHDDDRAQPRGRPAEALSAAVRGLVGGDRPARLDEFFYDVRTTRVRRPVVVEEHLLSNAEPVAAGPSGLNFLQHLAQAGGVSTTFSGPGSHSLLFALLRRSLQLTELEAALRIGGVDRSDVIASLEPEFHDEGLATAGSSSATGPQFLERSVRDLVGPSAGSVFPDIPVGRWLVDVTPESIRGRGPSHVLDAVVRLHAARSAVARLATRPSAELDRISRAMLDGCCHRLDAWITAYATRRLEDCRTRHASGVHVGGYAWVDGLTRKPDREMISDVPEGESGPLVHDPTNVGFVVAPSLGHAATAAVLLSGHLTHAKAGNAAGAFAVELSSDRVRTARWLLDGVRAGQPLGALLGYQFERSLHDASSPGLELDRFIRVFRAEAPLIAGRNEPVEATTVAVESTAPSNVVDGLALLALHGDHPERFNAVFDAASPTQSERVAVVAQLSILADTGDALGDLLLAESVHQAVAGHATRAAASIDAIGNGVHPPPELEVIETPRGGVAGSYRFVVAFPPNPSPAPLPGWDAGRDAPRRVGDPRLDEWVSFQLGSAEQIRAAVLHRSIGPDGSPVEVVHVRTVADLGVCALDLVYDDVVEIACEQVRAAVGFEGRARHPLDEVAGPADATKREVVRLLTRDDPLWPGSLWPATTADIDDAMAQARWLGDVIGSARPLDSTLLRAPAAGDSGGRGIRSDVDELDARAEEIAALLSAARDRLEEASVAADPVAVRSALGVLAGFGLRGAREAVGATSAALSRASEDVAKTAEALLAADRAADRQNPAERLRSLLGGTFVALAPITVPPEWSAAIVSTAANPDFLAGDAAAPVGWLHRSARVRSALERYLLATASGAGGQLFATQHPPTGRWIALADDPDVQQERPAGATSVVLHLTASTGTSASPSDSKLAGLLVDEWTEVVPHRATTVGVAFHFDEPGARAPQSLLVAVPPVLGQPWTLDALVRTVDDTADLARLRMVGPEEVPWMGRYLPALYVPFADSPTDTFTVDVADLAREDP